jgi:hypothetical protein
VGARAALIRCQDGAVTATLAEPVTEVRLRDSIRPGVAVFAAVWLGWAVLGLLVVGVTPTGEPSGVPGLSATPLSPGWHNLLDGGFRSDAYWYLRIAGTGYSSHDGSPAFYYGFPAAIKVLAYLPGVTLRGSATLIAQGSLLGGLIVMHALTRRELSTVHARLATRYLAIFPTAFFFLAPLTESPFLLLSLLTFWYARGGRWVHVLAPAMLAGATRSVGIALLPALLVEAYVQGRAAGKVLSTRLLFATAPLLGAGSYALIWLIRGDVTAPLDAQKNWGRTVDDPISTIVHAVRYAWRYQSYWLMDVLVVGIVIVALVAGARMLAASYLTYCAVSLLLPLSEPFPDRPLLSMPRFVVVLFPAMWVIAEGVRRRWLADGFVTAGFAIGFTILGTLYANAYFVF